MTTSVNTNYGASIALQNLGATQRALMETQSRINTGLKVAGPKDNGAIFNISQAMRADVQALGAVQRSLDRTVSVVDTAIAAGTNISDLLKDMKEKALAARDTTIDNTARAAYHTEFVALRDMISKTLSNAAFDGSNLTNSGTNLVALANADGNSFITVTARNMSLGGSIVTLAATASISTAGKASTALTTIETSLNNLNRKEGQPSQDLREQALRRPHEWHRQHGRRRPRERKRQPAGTADQAAAWHSGAVDCQPGATDPDGSVSLGLNNEFAGPA
jgi:flagellin